MRARAMSIYGIGVVLGAGAAYIVGGTVVEFGDELIGLFSYFDTEFLTPWRTTFIAVGTLSLLGLVFVSTIREPVRREAGTEEYKNQKSNPFVCTDFIWSNRHYHGRVILGLSIGAIVFNGVFAWVPSHFIRVFEWSPSQIGLTFGLILIAFGTCGMWAGGYWSDRVAAAGGKDGPAKVILLGEAVGGFSTMIFGFAPTYFLAIPALCVCVFSFSAAIAVGPVALQNLTPSRIRSQMIALYLLIVNILGLGIGPTLIAGVSDYVLNDDRLIGMSLSIVALVVMPIATYLLFRAWEWQCKHAIN
jgi:MFS family permease